jgi:ribosomal protein S21
MEIRKREKESIPGLLYRFNLKVKQSGILREAKKRRFHKRAVNRRRQRISALYREVKKKEIEKARKLGLI